MRLARIVTSLLMLGVTIASVAEAQDFVLRPGDAVRVIVPRDTTISGTYAVDQSAHATFPIIGRFNVGGQPWSAVFAPLMAAFRRELREPGITLIPMRRVVVLGAVNKAGDYLIEPSATLSNAVAAAAGAAPDGTTRRIRIVRDDRTIVAHAPRGQEIVEMPMQSGDRIFVQQRSWFERNTTFLITAMLSLTGIIATLSLR
ncbi:MAG: hypothetical protein FJ399_16245 [Verrucomicrobia bacterium]|nr:hypothetical protein [Verrucomicrobiota bacterium]